MLRNYTVSRYVPPGMFRMHPRVPASPPSCGLPLLPRVRRPTTPQSPVAAVQRPAATRPGQREPLAWQRPGRRLRLSADATDVIPNLRKDRCQCAPSRAAPSLPLCPTRYNRRTTLLIRIRAGRLACRRSPSWSGLLSWSAVRSGPVRLRPVPSSNLARRARRVARVGADLEQ